MTITRDDVLALACHVPDLEAIFAEILVRLDISEVDLWLAGAEVYDA